MRGCGVRSVECGIETRATERSACIDSALRIPHSPLGVKHRRLVGRLRRREAKVLVRPRRGTSAAWRPSEEALLHEERLVHLFERARILADGGGNGSEADRPSLELLEDGLPDPADHVVEAVFVVIEPLARL